MTDSQIVIASIYPTLLGTYGDGGNVAALVHRARLRDLPTAVIVVDPNEHIPRHADMYVLGGGEDTAQVAAAAALRADGGLAEAKTREAPILAICAGYQLIGMSFPDATGSPATGVGIIDVTTDRLPARAVGELLVEPTSGPPAAVNDLLTGYENHAGATHRGPGVPALGRAISGIGNGDGTEGATDGRTIGTYLHGPCLARNPQVADQLLEWVVGQPLTPVSEPDVEALRAHRIQFVTGKSR